MEAKSQKERAAKNQQVKIQVKLRETLMDLQEKWEHNGWGPLDHQLVMMAARYWENNIDDFCIQCVGGSVVVFGGLNRVKWTLKHGFSIERGYCSQTFREHWDKLAGVST
jgi:hypothetical protein